jgi:hypothetical protein
MPDQPGTIISNDLSTKLLASLTATASQPGKSGPITVNVAQKAGAGFLQQYAGQSAQNLAAATAAPVILRPIMPAPNTALASPSNNFGDWNHSMSQTNNFNMPSGDGMSRAEITEMIQQATSDGAKLGYQAVYNDFKRNGVMRRLLTK